MFSPIHALDQVCEACSKNEPMPEELRSWLAAALARFLDHGCETLNEAFGVTQGHGGIPWWRERAIRARDEALQSLAQQHFPFDSSAARARKIWLLSMRYAGTCWPRDREREEMPERYSGQPAQFLWLAFKSGAKMPVSERHLRTLLFDT